MKNLAFKKYLFVFTTITCIGCLCCSRPEKKVNQTVVLHANTDTNEPVIYEIGQIHAGTSAEFMLDLKNTRHSPIFVREARSFCGCTIPEFKSEPVLPGEFSRIKITFFAVHLGIFDKSVRIYLNYKETPVEFRLKGEVIRNSKAH